MRLGQLYSQEADVSDRHLTTATHVADAPMVSQKSRVGRGGPWFTAAG